MILLTDKAGKRVRYVCGHRSLIVPPVVGIYSRRCDVCHRWTVAEVRRSDLQDRAFIVEVRSAVCSKCEQLSPQPKDTP